MPFKEEDRMSPPVIVPTCWCPAAASPASTAATAMLPPDIVARSPLGRAWRRLDQVLGDFVAGQLIAA